MPTSDDLLLLGLAEQLSAPEVALGDPADEAALCALLDRCTDALVDVAQGRQTLSRPAVGHQGAPTARREPRRRHHGGVVDAGSCSALAALCHRGAHLLTLRSDHTLGAHVAECLQTVAESLQRLVQDLPDQGPVVARQRLRRGLRRAAAQLDRAAPKVAP